MPSETKLQKIFNKLEINIPSKILRTALTHSSVTFENSKEENYERLEFLGDSVLKLIVSEILYKSFPNYPEGRMTKIRAILVSDSNLAKLSKEIDLQDLIYLGKNEAKDGGKNKESVVACAFEAVLGAIYLTNGLEKSIQFIKKTFKKTINEVDEKLDFYNAKAVLQEYTQSQNKDLPEYKELKETGKAHDKTFTFGIYYHNEFLAKGCGKTKKEAQQEAAKEACIKLNILKGAENE